MSVWVALVAGCGTASPALVDGGPRVRRDGGAPDVGSDAWPTLVDAGAEPSSPEALTAWTSTDVIADAWPRARIIATDAELVWFSGEFVRPDGTIDLTSSTSIGSWNTYFVSTATNQAIAIVYAGYDGAAPWPAIEIATTFDMLRSLELGALPDSATFDAAFRAGGCTTPDEGISARLHQPSSYPLQLRLSAGTILVEYDVTASGLVLHDGSGC